jgi:NAD(P)-dependent dehydrogenase (short-subunit alcohol dehydrogenase family)
VGVEQLEGKVAIVTGGNGGIGSAIVSRFVAEGARVVVASSSDHDPFAGDDRIAFKRTDVALDGEVRALMGFTLERFGQLDVLVNCAGIQLEKTIEETSEAEWDRLIGINLKGTFLACKHALAPLRANGGGAIVNIGSYDGYLADPKLAAYCASKGGVHALSKAIAVDHGPEGIRCNVICPGWINTRMLSDFFKSAADPASLDAAISELHPLGRVGEPEDVAKLALWLASEESAFATGQLYVIDGGLTAHAPSFSFAK